MQYDPIKRSLGNVFNRTPFLRKLFYNLLDLLLLRAWHVHREIKRWEKTAPANASILDAGFGFGQHSYYMASRNKNWKIFGIDVKDEQVDDCNRFFKQINYSNIEFQVGDLTKFRKEDSYDLIVCVDVMEHIEEDVKVFENYYHSLHKGGMVLISTPSDQGGSDVHDHDNEESFIDEHVRDGYGIEEIANKMKRAGFSKTDVYYQYGPPGKLSWKLSMKYPILMLNTSYFFFIILPYYYLLTFPFVLVLNWMDVSWKHKTGTGVVARAWK